MTDTDPFQTGGDSLPDFKFTELGDKATGQIISIRQVPDRDLDGVLRTWPNGDDKTVWVFDIDTTGTGEADHSMWVRGNKYTAIRDALRDADIPTVGATIFVHHHALGDPPKKGYHPPKLFTAKAKAGPPLRPPTDPFIDNEDPF